MISRSVFLPRPPLSAFELFTGRASDWWPPERRHTKDPKSTITLSPTGRFSERSGDREVQLGKVRVWELRLDPGQRVLFHRHITPYLWVCVDGGRQRSLPHRSRS